MKLKTFRLLLVACIIAIACGNLALRGESNTAHTSAASQGLAEFVIPEVTNISFERLPDAIKMQSAVMGNFLRGYSKRQADKHHHSSAATQYVSAAATPVDADHTWLSDGWMYRLALCENGGKNHVSNLYMGYFEMTDWAWSNGGGPPGKPYQFSYAVNAATAKRNIQKAGMAGQHRGCRRTMGREGYQILS